MSDDRVTAEVDENGAVTSITIKHAAPERESTRWFSEFRYAWIKESVEIFGHINREHISRKFGLTHQVASGDLAEVQRRWPDLMTYNRSTKRFERNGD